TLDCVFWQPSIESHSAHARFNHEGMDMGTIVFVHGTGVRLRSYQSGFETAEKVAVSAGVKDVFVPCAWGDPIGIEFAGKSLPDPPPRAKLEEEERDFAQWNWLFDDPLFELQQLTIRDPAAPPPV